MAGFLSLGSDFYIGGYTSTGEVENGTFVVLDHTAKTGALADATTGDGDVYFVENEITTIPEQGIDDVDFKVGQGDFLRLSRPDADKIYVTTKFNGALNVGDEVAVGVDGAVEAVGTRTPQVKFIVKEKTTAYGTDAVKLVLA